MPEQLQPGEWVDITIRRALLVGETPATPEDVRVIVFGHDAIPEAVHLAVTDDVTIEPRTPVDWPFFPMLQDLSDVTPEMARHVLTHFGASGGHVAGSFTTSLIHTIACADPQNQAVLFTAFPGYVKAVVLAQRTDDGIARLQEIGRSDLVGPKVADHKRMMELVAQLSPESRTRIARGLDDRFHELTGEQQGGGDEK